MTTPTTSLVRVARLSAIALLLAACAPQAEKAEQGSLPPQAEAFRTYAAAKLHLPESHIDGGPTSEAEAAMVAERVGALWAMTMFHVLEPQIELRGWATPDGTVITVDQNLGRLLVEAGVWNSGVTPALTATQIASRLVWSLGRNHQVLVDPALGVAAPEIDLSNGAGTMTFVDDFGGAGGGPHDLTRFDIALTREHSATVTQTSLPAPQAP
jgi:hypothetical protein